MRRHREHRLTRVTPLTPVVTSVTRVMRRPGLQAKDIADTVAIPDEVEIAAAARRAAPHGVHVVIMPSTNGAAVMRDGRDVDKGPMHAPKCQAGEIGREAIRRKRERATVGRPCRMKVGERIVRQRRRPCVARSIVHRSVTPPFIPENAIDRPSGDHVGLYALVQLWQRHSRVADRSSTPRTSSTGRPRAMVAIASECRPIPGACRMEALKAFEVGVGRGRQQLANHPSGLASARKRSIEN